MFMYASICTGKMLERQADEEPAQSRDSVEGNSESAHSAPLPAAFRFRNKLRKSIASGSQEHPGVERPSTLCKSLYRFEWLATRGGGVWTHCQIRFWTSIAPTAAAWLL